MNSAT
jgi:hypothetical protein